jgi:alanyl-tRNA synthetase
MKASDIVEKYISFFEKRGHKKIANSPLVPQNDPTTLFTSSGMQPLVPYLLGETHPQGKRLVNVQNSFRAVDIEEVGDNRHTTFFRMLGNWSLGDYFKKEQLSWIFEFLTKEIEIDPEKLYVTIFEGVNGISRDTESESLWKELFTTAGINHEGRIFSYNAEKNWWSRSGPPEKMPAGEPGGPDSEIFYDFGTELKIHEHSLFKSQPCHVNCDCGRFIEISNSVFMQYRKTAEGKLELLPKPNVDFGGGLERILMAKENKQDVFKTSLFWPIIEVIQSVTDNKYEVHSEKMRIIADHLIAAVFIINDGIQPSKSEQGYILRRLIRRAYDNINLLRGVKDVHLPTKSIIEIIVTQYKPTDPVLEENYEKILNTILEEANAYRSILDSARKSLDKELAKRGIKKGDELLGTVEIPAELAFKSAASMGLGPLQLKSLGYTFDDQAYAEEMKKHQAISRAGAGQKFRGGLADHQERTIMGHTATHLMHQAIRDMLGKHIHQSGSNITTERVRFDFNYDQKLTDEQIKELEDTVNKKIQENLPVHFEMIPTKDAKKMGAIGLFEDTYQDTSKIYFIGGDSKHPKEAYSIEFCGGPHVDFTSKVKSFKIIKQESLGKGYRRLYAVVE